ncbi:MAG: STAS/SEC14 domain-containing protein [Ginsengibacter sp.]
MIEVIKGMPAYVAGFRATGKVKREDYQQIIYPLVDSIAKSFGKINYLLVIETPLSNYSAGAWIDDAILGIKYFSKWNKLAIVSHNDGIKKFTDVFGKLIPGETRGFKMEDLPVAKEWISKQKN